MNRGSRAACACPNPGDPSSVAVFSTKALGFAEQRNVPILEARSKNDVASGIAKRPLDCVCSKCARVEQRSRNTRFAVWIANHVWTRRVGNSSTAIGIGKVCANVRGRVPIAGRRRSYARDLPPADDLVPPAAGVSEE